MSFVKIDRTHFHTFDSLRFLSFLLVFLHHAGLPQNSFLNYFSKGEIGVSFFFVLSGFLITYILIVDKINNQGKIPLKGFFRRRILRIWPLYYAMVLFAFFTPYLLNLFHLPSSNDGYEPNWFLTFTFLENYKVMYTGSHPNVSPLPVIWSLCVEEHFYIIWGILLYFISLKRIPGLIITCLIIAFIFRLIYNILHIGQLDIFTNIDYFAFGAVPAYLFVFRKDFINKLTRISAVYKYIYFVFVIIMITLPLEWFIFGSLNLRPAIFGSLFSVLILTTLGGKNVFKISDHTILAWLGKYTYGLYLIHLVPIMLFRKIGEKYQLEWYVTLLLSFISTVILAFLSYHLFEKQFLKLKNKPSSKLKV
ncbi:acyltransferase [Chryseobacterium sp. SSA4.19]|uniref:acyltransferase family protein n=1 Tax=Chryseobacterium sp. SSA4.19 TaxID=2919915 RepID=UPI001F4EE78B|nr:acyltransferase [Chryseobacterium sp. SSA4.19]MCJ8155613.1 acyltransferase [Chryseobacterium sp. SSA4.19]